MVYTRSRGRGPPKGGNFPAFFNQVAHCLCFVHSLFGKETALLSFHYVDLLKLLVTRMQKQIMSLIIVKILFWEWQDSKGGIETKRKILVSDP